MKRRKEWERERKREKGRRGRSLLLGFGVVLYFVDNLFFKKPNQKFHTSTLTYLAKKWFFFGNQQKLCIFFNFSNCANRFFKTCSHDYKWQQMETWGSDDTMATSGYLILCWHLHIQCVVICSHLRSDDHRLIFLLE